MVWLLLFSTLAVCTLSEPYGIAQTPFNYNNYYRSYTQPPNLVVNAPAPAQTAIVPSASPPIVAPIPPPAVVVEQIVEAPLLTGPPLPGPPPPPIGSKCPSCLGPDCCELCVERSCVAPEPLTLLELALNPFFYVQYVEDCAQAQFLDNVCFLFVPLLNLASLFTFGQIITFQDGTVEQRQYVVDCVNDAYVFTAKGSGCRYKFEIIYADILCGVYIFQRCFENPCCQIDSGPIQIVSTLLPATKQCLLDALDYVKNLYPCKTFIELPQENASLCTLLGNTLLPSQG